ncbi:hypothetical protein L2Y96_10065 [Luteibacter aegosomaticola]|uniref:hypothetical protein n=1 Tax=Luteibacter aegosomaticola TaxID=2911538 RepID=UPI001FFA3842|nr:hypothetical protein [Luteibacter aegosomaticola]UPG92086.1 hypothetical protein L2Y96_10065 [Luteibacter aegosomaticola]
MKRMTKRALRRAAARVVSRTHFRAWLTPGSRRKRITPFSPEADIPFAAHVLPPNLARPITDLPDDEVEDGLITLSGYNNGFTVRLGALDDLMPDGYMDSDTFELTIFAEVYTLRLGDDPPDIIEFEVPAKFFGPVEFDHNSFDMTWLVKYGGSSASGLPAKLTIDTIRPSPGGAFLAALIFDDDIIKNGITSKTFAGADYIEATLPGYTGEKAADWIRPYVNKVMDTDPTHFAVVPYGNSSEVITLRFYRGFIEAQGDGEWDFQCDVMPREENPSPLSRSMLIRVSLEDAIDDLDEPAVPAYDDDPVGSQIIDEADARALVVVQIPSHPDITDRDSIEILFGDDTVTDHVRVENPDLIEISVEYAAVLAAWLVGNEDADDVTVAVDVAYNVISEEGNVRGKSAPHRVEINLHVAGGIIDPDPGTEPNENLIELETRSASDMPNRIPISDREEDATAKVPKLSRMDDGSDGFRPAFKAGDVIKIIARAGVDPEDFVLATYPVVEADLTPPDGELDIVLPWAELEKLPGGTIPFAYWIDTALAGGGTNTNKSPPTNVIIEDASALPGGGTLPAVIMPERGDRSSGPDVVPLGHIVNGVAIGFPVDIENFDPDTDTITLSIPMYAAGHKGGEAPVAGYGDVVGQNQFVLTPPHVVREAESGEVAEPVSGEPEYATRPPITARHILFRLTPDRLPELHGTTFYHSHVVWTIENSVGKGTSPTDVVDAMKVTFETRGTVTPPAASTGSHLETTAAAEGRGEADPHHDLAWILRRLRKMLS